MIYFAVNVVVIFVELTGGNWNLSPFLEIGDRDLDGTGEGFLKLLLLIAQGEGIWFLILKLLEYLEIGVKLLELLRGINSDSCLSSS